MNIKIKVRGKHILILEGYARQCLPYMNEFKKMDMEISILCNSILDCGYASKVPDHRIVGICNPERYKDSEKYIVNMIKNGKYDIVLPLVDFSASILSKHKKELSKYAEIYVNDYEVFSKSQDKLEVMKTCMNNNIPCPKTLDNIKTLKEILDSDLTFPIIIKPRIGCGAKGFHRFNDSNELQIYLINNRINLSDMVVQECLPIDSKLISENIFVDKKGKIKSAFLYRCNRFYPLSGGTGTFNETFHNKNIHKECIKLIKMMKLKGCVGVDLMIDSRDNVAKIIEINPRILACSKIGFEAGVNQAQQIIEDIYGNEVTSMMKYKSGISIRMSQIDILWFLKSKDRFNTNPSWFKLKGVRDQTFSLKDPLPWFAFLFNGLLKLKKER